jgi:hypothetical protein
LGEVLTGIHGPVYRVDIEANVAFSASVGDAFLETGMRSGQTWLLKPKTQKGVTRRNNLPLRVKFLSGWFLNFFPAFFRGIGYFPA